MLRRGALLEVAHEEGYTEVQVTAEQPHQIHPADLSATRDEIEGNRERAAARLVADLTADEEKQRLEGENPIGLADWVRACQP
jgi:hypothetical protein